jgi:hypothetical protein
MKQWVEGKGHTSVESWHSAQRKGKQRDGCVDCTAVKAYHATVFSKRNNEIDGDWRLGPGGSADQEEEDTMRHRTSAPQSVKAEETDEFITSDGHLGQGFWGMFTAAWDAWRSIIWDLFTHAGFHTYPHHDAAGFATYTYIRHGCKIWGILRPRFSKAPETRTELYDIQRSMLQPAPSSEYTRVSDIFYMFLLEGDVLVQVPHAIHQVYTPVNSIASGGHFMCYETLHLVELARRFDTFYAHVATNADHWSVHRTLCRMAMALPTLHAKGKSDRSIFSSRDGINTRTVFYRRPILALIAMICDPDLYVPDRDEESLPPGLSKWDLMRLEMQADSERARVVAGFIMQSHELTLEAVKAELERMGDNWKDGTVAKMDLSSLKVLLE